MLRKNLSDFKNLTGFATSDVQYADDFLFDNNS
jgi:hypothetical protein